MEDIAETGTVTPIMHNIIKLMIGVIIPTNTNSINCLYSRYYEKTSLIEFFYNIINIYCDELAL